MYFDGRGTVQREWFSVGPPLLGVRRVCCTYVPARNLHFLYFTIRACADAKWAAKRNQTSGTGSPTSSDSPVPLPRSIRHRRSDDESPGCKAVSAQEATSTVVSADKYHGPSVPKLHSVPYGWRQPSLPVSLPLPLFADRDFEPTPVRSSSDATQQYPSTVCVYLDDFDSNCSRSIKISSPVSSVVVDGGL